MEVMIYLNMFLNFQLNLIHFKDYMMNIKDKMIKKKNKKMIFLIIFPFNLTLINKK